MNEKHNKLLTPCAKRLRREMTREERHLWYDFLKTLPVTVNRQKVFQHYIADFYIASANIIIELDGSQHYEESAVEYDLQRDAYFNSIGLTVLRYSNYDVNHNWKGVCEDIYLHLFGVG